FVLFMPMHLYSDVLPMFFLFVFIYLAIGLISLSVSISRKRMGARSAMAGFLCIAGTGANDMLVIQDILDTYLILPFGLLAFIFSQSMILAIRFSGAFSDIEKLSDELVETNKSFIRFVPIQFLEL